MGCAMRVGSKKFKHGDFTNSLFMKGMLLAANHVKYKTGHF